MKLKKIIATLSIVTLLASQVNHLALAGMMDPNTGEECEKDPQGVCVSKHVLNSDDTNFINDLKKYEGDEAQKQIDEYLKLNNEERAAARNEYYEAKAEYEGQVNKNNALYDKYQNAGSSTTKPSGSNLKPDNSVYEGYDPNYTGVRQNAIQRSMVYADGIDADKVRKMASDEYTATKTKSLPTKLNAECNGYTTSSCGLTCCGKTECENICKDQLMTAYGKSTCLDGVYNSSYCGISCCGKADCERVCINYRVTINGEPADHGRCFPSSVTERDTGKTVSCCGYQDCREKECSGQLTVVNQDTGDTLNCCGAKECNQMKCNGYTSAQNVDTGVSYQCCGEYQCKQLECNGKLTVDSKINEGVKLSCCGTEDCESVACEGYTVANTPNGEVACCGYADCQNKKCEGQTAVDVNGTLYACCGKENCNQVYEDNKYKTCGKESVVQYQAHELYQTRKCLSWKTETNSPGTGQFVQTQVCTSYGAPYYVVSSSIATKCIKETCTSDYADTTGYHKGTCTCHQSSPVWQGNITTINYVKGYKKDCRYECQTKQFNCHTEGGTIPRTVCDKRTDCGTNCYTVPEYEDCMPKTASESMWHGQTIFTNYENCVREHGSFSPLTVGGTRLDVGNCTVR